MDAANRVLGAAWALFILLLSWSAASAQTPTGDIAPPDPRTFTVAGGIGHSLGWAGGQAEYYTVGDRVSLFAALGYTPDPSGASAAVGVRGYTSGANHRALLELSYSQLSAWARPRERNYGPGLQVGYQFTAAGGFTVLTSLGVGLEFDGDDVTPRRIMNLGLGHTWR